MKKMMMIAAVAATMISPAETNSADSVHENAMRMLANYEACYETNGFWNYRHSISSCSIFTNQYATNPEFKAEAIRIMSQKPSRFALLYGRALRPLSDKAIEYIEHDFPAYAKWFKIRALGEEGSLTDGERLQSYLEKFAVLSGGYSIDLFRRESTKIAMIHLRRKLRTEGEPIVGDVGKAIIKERIDAVTKALDEPMFAGIQDALAECGVSIKAPSSYEHAYSMDNINKAMEKVYYGDVPFSKNLQYLFRFYLGTKKYNEFVDRYNSGYQK